MFASHPIRSCTTMNARQPTAVSWTSCAALVLAVSVNVLALVPFVGTLEIQHALASDTGTDQGTPSDFDLCVWMAIHVASLVTFWPPALSDNSLLVLRNADHASHTLVQSRALPSTPSRAPPVSV